MLAVMEAGITFASPGFKAIGAIMLMLLCTLWGLSTIAIKGFVFVEGKGTSVLGTTPFAHLLKCFVANALAFSVVMSPTKTK